LVIECEKETQNRAKSFHSDTKTIFTTFGKIFFKMRAIVFDQYGPPEVLRYAELPTPQPKGDEVLVRVRYASVNPKDCLIRKGKFSTVIKGTFPHRLGSDFAGEVVQLPSRQQEKPFQFAIGEKVYGMLPSLKVGAYTEYLCIKARHLGRMPSGWEYREAASVPLVGLTSLQALRDLGKLKAGDKLCINGASGGVGTLAIQLAKSMGAQVWAICSGGNADLVKSLGADEVIDYKKVEPEQTGLSFDLFYDVYGNKSLKRVKGILSPYGGYITTIPSVAHFRTQLLSSLSKRKSKVVIVKPSGQDLNILAKLAEDSKLKAVVDQEFPIEEAARAHAYIETRRARGKVLLKMT
jgi:NADPH:quinone reductase-like Zn-dependent oxidoreductase